MFTKKIVAAAAVAVASLGLAAGSANAAITPASTLVTASTPTQGAVFTVGSIFSIRCTGTASFTTPATGNGPVPLTSAFTGCNTGSVTTRPGNTISAFEPNDGTTTDNVEEETGINVRFNLPASGGYVINALGCTVTVANQTIVASGVDGSNQLTFNDPVSYTSSGVFCVLPSSGTANFAATYTANRTIRVS